MAIDEKKLQTEKNYLEVVKDILNKLIIKAQEQVGRSKQDINEIKKFLWDNLSDYTDEERGIALSEVNHSVDLTNRSIDSIYKYEKATNSPYFAKLVFNGAEFNDKYPIYIGMTTISEKLNFYVFDWRAPISSMFYNYEIGDAKYETPRGEISGTILEKMQFKIVNGEIVRCFDSDINIDDEYLQEILASATTDKMKNIVSTIQREQNEIIRNEKDKNLIVQGVAGSGKTSVALHRNAYLLYRDLNLSCNNILIFSPNDIFSDYISEVMPDLGEENILNSTFSEFSLAFLKPYKKIESYSEFLERVYGNALATLDNEIRYKMSNQYQNDIVDFVAEYKKSIVFNKGISHNDVKITAEELKIIYEKFNQFPLKEKFEYMIDSVCHTLGLPRRKYFNSIKKTLLESSNINFNFIKLYQLFLTAYNIEKTDNFKKDKINYEDITGLLYIYFSISGYPNYNYIKQIVIDEVQDYTPFQLSLIKRIFKNAAFTILGDINQGINPYQRYNSLADLKDIYDGNAKYIELTKTYRSSEEIIDYSNTILGINNVCSVRHNNNIPVDIKDVPNSEILRALKEDIINMDKLGMKKIAIITRDVEQAKELYLQFENSKMDIQLIACSDSKIVDSKIIIPSYLSKGLEFDGVIVYNNPDKPFTEEEGNLYYVVCTRAQHKLNIYNEPKRLILNKL